MWSRYLNDDPLPWLLEDNDRLAKYLTLRDILRDSSADKEYAETEPSSLKIITSAGFKLSPEGRGIFDDPRGGALSLLAAMVSLGLDSRTRLVQECAAYLVRESIHPSGGFSYSWRPRVPVSCLTGVIARLLFCSGTEESAARQALEWIAGKQRSDGGWLSCPIAGLCGQLKFIFFNRASDFSSKDKQDKFQSCPYASVACGLALSGAVDRGIGIPGGIKSIEKVSDFLFAKDFFNRGLTCAKIYHRDDPLRLSAPAAGGFDLLNALTIPAEAGILNRAGVSRYFNALISKQNPDGTWNLEGKRSFLLGDKKGSTAAKNKRITIVALKIISRV